MKGKIRSTNAWHCRRQQRSLERWEQVRAKGKARFVLHQALTFTVFMSAFRDVSDQIVDGGSQVSNFGVHLISYALAGVFIGFFAWWNREGKYRDALLTRRLQTPFDDRISPR